MIAEIALGRKSESSSGRLQWGRDQMIAEMRYDSPAFSAIVRASMGPRSNDRGNELSGRRMELNGRVRFNGAAIK